MNLMPKWMRELPFAGYLAPIDGFLFGIGLLGLLSIVLFFVDRDPFLLVQGVGLWLPFAFCRFLLWRLYCDGGYKEGKDG